MRLLNIQQAAEKLELSTRTIYRLVSEQKIPYCHITNNTLRFPEEELDEWLSRQIVRPAEGRMLRLERRGA